MIVYEEKGYYSVAVDSEKNRIYLSFFGHIAKLEQIPNYNKHVEEAISQVKAPFTLLANISKADKAPGLRASKPLQVSQKQFMDGGVSKTAVVLKETGQLVHALTLRVGIRFTGMDAKIFNNKEEAEVWLDEQAE